MVGVVAGVVVCACVCVAGSGRGRSTTGTRGADLALPPSATLAVAAPSQTEAQGGDSELTNLELFFLDVQKH